MAKRALRTTVGAFLKPFDLVGLKRIRISDLIWVKDRLGQEVVDYQLIHPARKVDIAQPNDADFLAACPNYSSGVLNLGEVFVCEIAPALYYPGLGLVANEKFQVFGDSVLLPHRFHLSPMFRSLRPLQLSHREGPVSSIQRIDTYYFWHWMADCLPQLLTLEKYMNGAPLTLLMSEDLGGFQRETLSLMLPPNMKVEFVPGHRWIKADRFILPSYLSGRCNGYLAEDYYAEIRRRITRGLGLPETGKPELRIYLSRAGARRRRPSNEGAIAESLRRFGFEIVRAETLSIREQVSLLQRAAVIVAPSGAALGGMIFAPHAKVLVIYAERHPGEYFYTMARRMGIEHHSLVQDCDEEEDLVEDFVIDQARLESMLEHELGLSKQ